MLDNHPFWCVKIDMAKNAFTPLSYVLDRCSSFPVIAIVAAAALAVVLRRLGDDQRGLDTVAQADQGIVEARGTIEGFDVLLQVA